MRKFILPLIAVICFTCLSPYTNAQDSAKVDPSLLGQYQLMLSKSRTLEGYKLVNPNRLSSFWKNVRDTVTAERKELYKARTNIATQEKTIVDLNAQIANKETALNTSNARLDEITFLGMSFSKANYNSIVWSLIILLALALVVVILRSIKLSHEAKYRTNLYTEIAEEYQNYKMKTNEKEKKLARELQDERNKLDEYRSTGR